MPVKPFTLMGEGMLVTVGALMPGGVLPPADPMTERYHEQLQWIFSTGCYAKVLLPPPPSYSDSSKMSEGLVQWAGEATKCQG